MKNKYALIIVPVIIILSALVLFSNNKSKIQNPTSTDFNNSDNSSRTQTASSENYKPFDKSSFDTDLANGKKVTLYFWANWCPTCRAQEPINQKILESINDPEVVVYKVNIFDSETTKEGEELSEKYGVTIQHTFVVLDSGGQKVDIKNGLLQSNDLERLLTQERI